MKIKSHQRDAVVRDLRLSIILLAIFTLAFALHLVRTPQSLWLTIVSLMGVFLVVPIVLPANPTLIKTLRNSSARLPIIIAAVLWAFSQFYALAGGQWSVLIGAGSLLWLAALVALMLIGHSQALRPRDYLLVLLFWLPLELGLFNISLPTVNTLINPYALIGLFVLIFHFVVRQNFDIGYTFRLKGDDYRIIVLNFLLFFMIAVMIGVLTRMLAVSDRLPSFSDLFTRFTFIFFLIALPEELLFRGIIYKMLVKSLTGSRWAVGKAMALSSILFGLAQGNNLLPPMGDVFLGSGSALPPVWGYVLFSTVAGFFYALVFIRTQKITAAAVLHLAVDFVWFAFFRG